MAENTRRTPLGVGSRGRTLLALAPLGLALLGLGVPVHAADVTVQTAPGSSFVVTDTTGASQRFKVLETGQVFLGGLSPVPPVEDIPLCYNATSGQVGACPGAPGAPVGLVDNGDGTVTDNKTGLIWEKKTGTVGSLVDCSTTTCSNLDDVNNLYKWSASGTAPDGGLYTDFLERVNGKLCATSTCPGLAGHSDWRVPTLSELQTIVDLSATGCGTGSPCIMPVFGPTVLDCYWSSAAFAGSPTSAWGVNFFSGDPENDGKTNGYSVRAVRGGL
jgi:hypothetical protein